MGYKLLFASSSKNLQRGHNRDSFSRRLSGEITSETAGVILPLHQREHPHSWTLCSKQRVAAHHSNQNRLTQK